MTAIYVDTDVLVRLIAGDDPIKRQAAAALFSSVEDGRVTLACPVTVIADAVYVLTSPRLYAMDRAHVAGALTVLVDLPRFRVDRRRSVRRALELYAATRLDFGDAMLLASMEAARATSLYSYDREFDQFPPLKRLEP